MEAKKRIFSREDFLILDDDGNYFVSQIGIGTAGSEVWQWRACDKPNCNCVGGWEAGNKNDAEFTVDRPAEGEQVVVLFNDWGRPSSIKTVKIK